MFEALIDFWFNELEPDAWRKKSPELDEQMRVRFADLHRQAEQGELWGWRDSSRGWLAEIILLDQFSRNLWRATPRAFASDGMALVLAQEAVSRGIDQELSATGRFFLYMPYMHSESLAIHEQAVELFGAPELADSLQYELRHLEILQRFGRYPHRNAILGRVSTDEERVFLQQPGSSF